MKKENTAQKYFNQKSISVLDCIFIALAAISLIAGNFIPGAAAAGIVCTAVFLIALYFSRTKRIKDGEIDELASSLMQKNQISPDSQNYICTYDLSYEKLRKGKDGKIRSPFFVISRFVFDKETVSITVWRFDLINNKTILEKYTVEKSSVSYVENKSLTPFGEVNISLLSSDLFASPIPVRNNDLAASEIVKRLVA